MPMASLCGGLTAFFIEWLSHIVLIKNSPFVYLDPPQTPCATGLETGCKPVLFFMILKFSGPDVNT